MHEKTQEAMAIVRRFGKPDLSSPRHVILSGQIWGAYLLDHKHVHQD